MNGVRPTYNFVNTGASAGQVNLVVSQSTATPLIYQDTFNRNGILNASAPSFQNGTNNTWVGPLGVPTGSGAYTTTTTSGGQAQENLPASQNEDDFSAYLPFTPAAGQVYTLSVQMSAQPGTGSNLLLGFGNSGMQSNSNQGSSGDTIGGNSTVGMEYWDTNVLGPAKYGTNSSISNNFPSIYSNVYGQGPSDPATVQIVLDTTGGLSNATVYWLLNGTIGAVGNVNASTITTAAFGTFEEPTAIFQNFSLASGAYWTGPSGATGSLASWTNNTVAVAGSLSNYAGWAGGYVPTNAGTTATFGPSIGSTDQAITLDSSPTVGELVFANTAFNSSGSPGNQGNYTIAQGSMGTLTFDNLGAGAEVFNYYGNNTISAPVSLNDNLSLQVSAGTGLTFSGGISDTGSHALTINPGGSAAGQTGTLTLSAANTYAGGTTVLAGTLRVLNGSSGSATGTGPVTIQSGATLTVPSGASATIAPTGSNAVTIAGGGMLTLGPSTGLTAATLTLGNGLSLQNGAILNFTAGSPSSTPIVNLTSGSVIVSSGTATVNILDSPTVLGAYPLLAQTSGTISSSGFSLSATVPSQYTYSLQNLGSDLDLVVTQGVSWTGANNNGTPNTANWDILTTANWANGSYPAPAVQYVDNTAVTFGDTNLVSGAPVANYIVAIQSLVQPQSVTFTNVGAANLGVDYTIENAGGVQYGIGGSTGITLNGNGSVGGNVTLAGANSFTGAVAVNYGQLIVANSGALPGIPRA